MKKTSGWYKDKCLHALASRGVKTKEIKMPPFNVKGKRFVVVDIDGTLFDISKRWEFISKKYKEGTPQFWDEMAKSKLLKMDEPINGTASFLTSLHDLGINIIYLSGRRTNLTKETLKALRINGYPYGHVILRPKGLGSEEFKTNILKRIKINNQVLVHIGDRESDKMASVLSEVPFVQVNANKEWNSKIQNSIKKLISV
jgi:predicted secreted acid phosphatase